MNEKKIKIQFCLYIFFIALALRITIVLFAYNLGNSYLSPDSYDYIKLAEGIISKHVYGISQPEIFRVPGYPVIISLFIFIFNKFFLISLLVFQAVVDSATCLLTYKLSILIFRNNKFVNKISVLGGIFQIISILAIVYCSKILSETIFTFLFILILFLLQRSINNFKYRKQNIKLLSVIVISLLSVFVCYIRAIFLPLSIFFNIIIYCFNRKFLMFFLGVSVILGCIGIWCVRNYEVANYIGFSSVSSINLYRYNACAVKAVKANKSYQNQQNFFDYKLKKYPSQYEKAQFAKKRGMEIIINNPILYMRLHLKGDIKTLFPAIGEFYQIFGYKIGGSGTLAVINTKGLFEGVKHYFLGNIHLFFYAIPLTAFLLLKYLTFLYAFFYIIFFKDNTEKILHFIYLLIVLYFLIVPGPLATPRFRVPVEPLLNIYSAFGFIIILNKVIFTKFKNKVI